MQSQPGPDPLIGGLVLDEDDLGALVRGQRLGQLIGGQRVELLEANDRRRGLVPLGPLGGQRVVHAPRAQQHPLDSASRGDPLVRLPDDRLEGAGREVLHR